MNFEQRVREDLLTYLAGRQEIDVPMPECPDVEEAWRKVGEDYMPDGIREFNAYPTVSLGWIMFVGMAMAQLWDTDWQRADADAHIYNTLRDVRGFDHTDDYILDEVLGLDAEAHGAVSRLVNECANRALALLDSYMKEGHSAHSEVMITTCLHNHGMKIGDIGGMGEFTPDGYRNRYYIKGVGTNNGTMRWRPPFTMEEVEALGTKNRLFHPIK